MAIKFTVIKFGTEKTSKMIVNGWSVLRDSRK